MRREKEKIGINVFYSSKVDINGKLSNILWGIEEEEIPYILIQSEDTDAKIMGSTASKSSKLGVGIGIGEKEVTLYQEKLEMDKPLFRYDKYLTYSISSILNIPPKQHKIIAY